jgi:hypothetical protein
MRNSCLVNGGNSRDFAEGNRRRDELGVANSSLRESVEETLSCSERRIESRVA